jgi:hypothetical protein
MVTYANIYPMAPGAGVFFALIGIAILAGAAVPRHRDRLLLAGGVVALVTTVLLAGTLAAPHGVPTPAQIWWLVGAIALESALVPLALHRYGDRPERTVILMILGIVALHFLPMAPAFGWLMIVLAVAASVNILVAWKRPQYPLRAVWAVDGAIKVSIAAPLFLSGSIATA